MPGMTSLRGDIVNHIIANCPARTNDALRESLGISYNTLRKIERGEPIRRSLAVRLEARFGPNVSA